MATTTPNYGWAVPTSTDLVKDGATAIETLGDAIDASMNTALGTKKAGMVLLNTTSFSGVASQSLPNNTFTSTYTNYLIQCNLDLSSSTELRYRLRLAGTDNSANSYILQYNYSNGSTNTAGNLTSTAGYITINSASGKISSNLHLYDPCVASRTQTIANFINLALTQGQAAVDHNVATAFDSISIFPNSGNMTGTIFCYGYNK